MFLSKSQITFIIPLDFSRRSNEILHRALQLCYFFEKHKIYVKFGLNDSNQVFSTAFKKKIEDYHFVSYETESSKEINLSRLRNIALKKVTTEYVVFLDVDIYINKDALEIILADDIQNGLSIYPCLYLTAKGNKLIKRYRYQDFINLYFSFRRDIFLHIAFPSSIMICDIQTLKAIDYFDENFVNHGYEDFDILLRILQYKKLLNTDAYFGDKKYISLASMNGLRLQICLPFLNNLKNNHFFFHLYHQKIKAEAYYKYDNSNYFKNKHCELLKNPPTAQDNFYLIFLDFCLKNNLDINKYLVFFDPMPGHMWRSYNLNDFIINYINKILSKFINFLRKKRIKDI